MVLRDFDKPRHKEQIYLGLLGISLRATNGTQPSLELRPMALVYAPKPRGGFEASTSPFCC